MTLILKALPKSVKEYMVITLGVFLMAISVVKFFNPYSLVMGGISGLAIVVYEMSTRWWGSALPIWITNFAFNLPIIMVSAKVFGLRAISKTIYAMVMFTVALYIMELVPSFSIGNTMLVAIFGGVTMGAGISLVLRCSATTGGTSALANLVHQKFRYISIARILFMLDFTIIIIGLITFDIYSTLHAIISIYIASRVIDAIVEGLNFSKAVLIVSDQAQEVSTSILEKLNRGVTSLHGEGMYSRQPKNVLLCIVSNKEIVELKNLVYAADNEAFVIVADVREVLGKGFKVAG